MSDTLTVNFSILILSSISGKTPNSEINNPPNVSASTVSGSIFKLKKLINSSNSIFASTINWLSEIFTIS